MVTPGPVQRSGSRRSQPLPPGWKKTRLRILARDGNACYLCGKWGNEVDHVIPAIRGGGEEDSNLATICDDCHKKKSAREARGPSRKRVEEKHPGLF